MPTFRKWPGVAFTFHAWLCLYSNLDIRETTNTARRMLYRLVRNDGIVIYITLFTEIFNENNVVNVYTDMSFNVLKYVPNSPFQGLVFLFSFTTNSGGFESFLTLSGALVVAVYNKKEYHYISTSECRLQDDLWVIGVVFYCYVVRVLNMYHSIYIVYRYQLHCNYINCDN